MFVLPISTLLWSAVNDVAMLAFTLFTSDTPVFNLSWCNTLKGPSLLSTLVYVRATGLPLISILTPGYWIAEHFCLNAKNDKSRQIPQTYLAEVCWSLKFICQHFQWQAIWGRFGCKKNNRSIRSDPSIQARKDHQRKHIQVTPFSTVRELNEVMKQLMANGKKQSATTIFSSYH